MLVLKVFKEMIVIGWVGTLMSLVTGAFPSTSCDVRSLIALALFQVMGLVEVLLLIDPPNVFGSILGNLRLLQGH